MSDEGTASGEHWWGIDEAVHDVSKSMALVGAVGDGLMGEVQLESVPVYHRRCFHRLRGLNWYAGVVEDRRCHTERFGASVLVRKRDNSEEVVTVSDDEGRKW